MTDLETAEDRVLHERRARDLLQAIALSVSSAADADGALRAALAVVCAHTGWPVGHCFRVDADGALASSGLWHPADAERFAALREVTGRMRFPPGVGLPGRVLATGHRAWIPDVQRDPNFPRAASVGGAIGAGFAFPVLAGGRVTAVLEFFAETTTAPDDALLQVMDTLGLLVGQVIERRGLEQALVDSEQRFRSVTESAQDAIVAADGEGRVLFWNDAAARMFGRTSAEMLGEPLDGIIPERYRAAHRAGMARFRDTGESRVLGRVAELAGLRRDGTEFPLELSLGHWRAGERTCFTAVLRDVTGRREAEDRLREAASELARKNDALERSHAELLRSWQQAERIFAAYAEILPGTEIDGRYRLEHRIGSGGYGIVYRAVQIGLDRPVAVKLFRPASGRITPDHVRRFRLEGISACRVNHPNAVVVLDSGVSSQGLPFIVMELLEGQTLGQALRRGRRLAPARTVTILRAVSEALAAAHDAGIVHRDVKPDNVFLHQGRDGEVVKILDFGIAKLVGDTPDDLAETATGKMIGTPAYMSPERLQGHAYDGRADVYSVGVLLYELLTGRPPFRIAGDGAHWDLVRQHLSLVPPPLAELLPGVPASLDAIARRALAKDPAERPTAAELAAALAGIAAPELPDEGLEVVPLPGAIDATVDLTPEPTDPTS